VFTSNSLSTTVCSILLHFCLRQCVPCFIVPRADSGMGHVIKPSCCAWNPCKTNTKSTNQQTSTCKNFTKPLYKSDNSYTTVGKHCTSSGKCKHFATHGVRRRPHLTRHTILTLYVTLRCGQAAGGRWRTLRRGIGRAGKNQILRKRSTKIALALTYKHLVHNLILTIVSMSTKDGALRSPWRSSRSIWCTTASWEAILWTHSMVHWNRPGSCIQASGAQPHVDNHLKEHTWRSAKIALALVYKHLVHNLILRNSLMNTMDGPRQTSWILFASAWRQNCTCELDVRIALDLVYKHLVTKLHLQTGCQNRPGSCIQASGDKNELENRPGSCIQASGDQTALAN
jgi:hypothetical protein